MIQIAKIFEAAGESNNTPLPLFLHVSKVFVQCLVFPRHIAVIMVLVF